MNALEKAMRDISPDFSPNDNDARIMKKLIEHEATPEAIKVFAAKCRHMSNYGYWFGLSTLWVSYTGWSDLELWKQLFRSDRPRRETSIMKPSELSAFRKLPDKFVGYRAHRPNETDWISYALDPEQAALFAIRRGVDRVSSYSIRRDDVLCLLLRRGETEILVLDKSKAEFIRHVDVVVKEAT